MRSLVILCLIAAAVAASYLRKVSPMELDEQPDNCFKLVFPSPKFIPGQPIVPIIPVKQPTNCSSDSTENDYFADVSSGNATSETSINSTWITPTHAPGKCCSWYLPPLHLKPNEQIGPYGPICTLITCPSNSTFTDEFDALPQGTVGNTANGTKVALPPIVLDPEVPIIPIYHIENPINGLVNVEN